MKCLMVVVVEILLLPFLLSQGANINSLAQFLICSVFPLTHFYPTKTYAPHELSGGVRRCMPVMRVRCCFLDDFGPYRYKKAAFEIY